MIGEVAVMLAGAFIIVILLFIAIAITLYLLLGFGLKRLSEREGLDNSWMAFVPFLNLYLIGLIAEKQSNQSWKQHIPLAYPGLIVGSIILDFIPVIGFLLSIASLAFSIYVMFLLYERYSSQAIPFTIFTVITFGILFPILIFILRNNEKLTDADIKKIDGPDPVNKY
ncbi:hypothetical protein [Alkalihalobacillus sp. 1P02AB]|uniref:hypothetical protein n=1 Tax=Alkalihalobacillus sp. 1P02AB TaxID=3132260 RepID=UPI0039A72C11